jgi:hypothetical protein
MIGMQRGRFNTRVLILIKYFSGRKVLTEFSLRVALHLLDSHSTKLVNLVNAHHAGSKSSPDQPLTLASQIATMQAH